LSGGEVAPVDLTRAQLQTLTRRDELRTARANEQVAAGALRVLVGYEFTQPIMTPPIWRWRIPTPPSISSSKLMTFLDDPSWFNLNNNCAPRDRRIKIARADRLPSLSYSINGGFDTDSLKGPPEGTHRRVCGDQFDDSNLRLGREPQPRASGAFAR
jgi:outer membrane protein TolC